MMKRHWLVGLIVIATLLATTTGDLDAQTVPSKYFPLTGHTVRGEFLTYFEAHGGLEIFGYPITEELVENGRQVQYFQRMRLDLYPENPAPRQVRPGPLGELLGRGEPPIPPHQIPPPGDTNRRYFPETGHTVVFSFLNFFNEHGGLDLFGYPITEYNPDSGVQYFQCARMEWHPDLPPAQRVRLGNLGEAYAALRLNPHLLEAPGIIEPALRQVIALKTIATLQRAITGRTGTQTLHVYVMDQLGRPLQNAHVSAVIHFPAGDQTLTLPLTDSRGYTALVFPLGTLAPGQRIAIEVRVGFGAVSTATRTSFLVWW